MYQLEIAKTRGLDHVGMPIRSDTIESLFGVGKHHGVGQTQDAARIALRLPAFCGSPTREEAQEVLTISVARQRELTAAFTSLTQQRREVLGQPEHLERLGRGQGEPQVERMPSPKNRSNHKIIEKISMSYGERSGPQIVGHESPCVIENVGPPDMREAVLT